MIWPPDHHLCPPGMRAALDRYAADHHELGDFLMAVLRNDLREAIGRADDINGPALPHIVAYIYWELPSTCWGSPERVTAWLARRNA